MVSVKKPGTIRRSHQKISNDLIFLKDKDRKSNKGNLTSREIESNEPKKELYNINSKKSSDKNINVYRESSYKNNNININERNIRIAKEFFDSEKYDLIEEEMFQRGEGYCFGEWALIYKQPRSASIFTLEDCVFFTLDETPFKNSFLKSLNNSEFIKKKFALKNFLPFDMTDDRQLSIYKNIVPITCQRNQTIFNEGDCSDSIYLIYLGTFILEKNYGYKKFSVLNLEKGSIVGLESIFESVKSKYKCSLRLSNGLDYGIIFQLKVNKLRPYIINKMKICFSTNYNVFLNSWKELFTKKIFVKQSISTKSLYEKGNKRKSELILDYLDNNKNNLDIYQSNYYSFLKLKMENKYESMIKKFLKLKDYKNRKKNGSLRIFSSKQRSRIYGKDDDENNNKRDNFNIIKYFREFSKKNDYIRYNLKTAHQLRIKKLNSLNYVDNLGSSHNTMRRNIIKNKSIQSQTNTESNRHCNDEIIQKYSKTENEINNYKYKETNKLNQKPQNFKFNVKLYDDSKILENQRYYPIENKKELLEFFDNNSQKECLNKALKNKNKLQRENRIKNNLIFNKNKEIKSINSLSLKIAKTNRDIIQRVNKKRNGSKTITNYKLKDEKFFKNSKENYLKKNYFRNINNKTKSNSNRFLDKKFSSTQDIFSIGNDKKIRLTLKAQENNKVYKNNFSQNNIIYENRKVNKSIQKNIEDKSISYKEVNTFSGKFSKIIKEFNLNNGFSISYFKKINSINYYDNFEIIKNNEPISFSSNKFKIAFDSGDFNIPLVSSSLRWKGSNIK